MRSSSTEIPTHHADPRVGAAIAGDRAAAEAILSELLPRIRNLVRYLVRGDHDVDDISQVACIEILKSLRTWRGESSLDSWALRITARVARRQAKKVVTERRRREAAAPELRAVPAPGTPDTYMERRQLAQLLDEIPDNQREVLVLHHVMGLSVKELSGELNIPFETARSRLRLGMKRLRALHRGGGER